MCDFSLHNVKSRPAKVGDKLITHNFNTGTRGFAAPEGFHNGGLYSSRNGTRLFRGGDMCTVRTFWLEDENNKLRTAIFRQINKDVPLAHHDGLEFPDGTFVLLTAGNVTTPRAVNGGGGSSSSPARGGAY